jgi:hypothetical protein
MPLTSVDRVLAWCKKEDGTAGGVPPERQGEVDRCIVAASRALARITGLQLERVTRSISLDGDDAVGRSGHVLRLPRGDRPVLHTTTPNLVTVMESGVALTVATGYSETVGVILRGANADAQCELLRNYSPWMGGIQNILVGYKCGWTLDVAGDTQPVPDEVIQLVNALAWMMFLEPAWLGKLNVSSQGSAVTLSSELPKYEGEVLERLMGL